MLDETRTRVKLIDFGFSTCIPHDKNVKIFLKVDTQGFDMETLIGLGSKIKQVYLIKIELSVIHLYKKSFESFQLQG